MAKIQNAFSIVEVMIVVSVIALLAGITVTQISGLRERAGEVRSSSDIDTVNRAVSIYLASGGNLAEIDDPRVVVRKLQSRRSDEDARVYAGAATGSVIDENLTFVVSESRTDRNLMRWDTGVKKFLPAEPGDKGVKGYFALSNSAEGGAAGEGGAEKQLPATEQRDKSALSYSASEGWIWDFAEPDVQDSSGPDHFPTAAVRNTSPPPSSIPPVTPPDPKPPKSTEPTKKKVALTFTQLSSSSWALNEAFLTVDGKTFRLGNSDMGSGATNTIEVEIDITKTVKIDLAVFSTPRYKRPTGEFYQVAEGFYPVNSFNGDIVSRIEGDSDFSGKGSSGAKYKTMPSQGGIHIEVGVEDTFDSTGGKHRSVYKKDYDYDDFRFSIISNHSFPATFGGVPLQ